MRLTRLVPLALACLVGCANAPRADAPSEPVAGSGTVPPKPAPPIPGAAPGEALVLLFGAVDCPIANGYAPELASLAARCRELGMRMVYVYPAGDVTIDEAKRHGREYALGMPVLLDPTHRLVDAVGATVTPEAAVVRIGAAADLVEVLYRGRIDDRYPARGTRRVVATTHELRDAIEAVASGRPVAVPRTTATGCVIERLAR